MPRRVLVGTPAHTGVLDVRYVDSLVNSVKLCASEGIELYPVFLAFESILPHARNELIKIALDTRCDDLIFIDADEEWKPEWVPRLLSHSVDVVGAPVVKKSEIESYNVHATSIDLLIDFPTGLLIVDALGTGFLRLSRKVMLALWESSEWYRNNNGPQMKWVFDHRPVDGVLVGEDIFLGRKLKDLGFTTYLDPSMTCSHIGSKKFEGNFALWLAKLQKEARAANEKESGDVHRARD